PVLEPRIDLAGFVIGKIDNRNPAYATLEEVDIALRRQVHIGIDVGGLVRLNIDFPKPLDVDHAFNVDDGHFSIPSECDGPWRAPLGNAVVEKLIVDAFPGYQRPGEEQFGHAGIGFDIVSQKIVNGFVPAEL